ALRTKIFLIFSWIMVFVVGSAGSTAHIVNPSYFDPIWSGTRRILDLLSLNTSMVDVNKARSTNLIQC
ncbi:MAG: hypothetical protein DIU81_009420, partial [[Clostridium] cellulosi]